MNRTKTEIDDFLKKSTVLQQTIKGLAEGSINEDQIDLREHGIYTPEQQKQEDERKAKARKEWEARQEQKKIEEREEEKRHWWAGATYFYGPVIGEDTEEGRDGNNAKPQDDSRLIKQAPAGHSIQERYSSDYSRWDDNAYKPDDEATKEEEQIRKDQVEKLRNDEFEKANQEWCNEMKQDLKERQDGIQKREESASLLRLKGNKLFKRKKYTDALSKYSEALEKTPYAVKILTNIALVHEKMQCWEEVIEYCDRAIHVDKNCIKAWFLRHKALVKINNEKAALKDIDQCIAMDPDNEEFRDMKVKLTQKMQSDLVEAEVRRVSNDQVRNHDTQNDEANLNDDHNILEKIEFIVNCSNDDAEYDSMIKKQFQCIEDCMDYFKRKGFARKVSDINTSIQLNVSLFKLFVQWKLCKCPIACTYFRKLGYLSQMVEKVTTFCKSHVEAPLGKRRESRVDIVEIIFMISEVSKIDPATCSYISECGVNEVFMQLFQQSKLDDLSDIELVVSVGQMIASFLCESYTDKSCFIPFIKDQRFVQSICEKLKLCLDIECPPGILSSICNFITSCADLISAIFNDCKLRKKILCSSFTRGLNPVSCLLMTTSIKNHKHIMKVPSLERSNMRNSIIKALLTLSALDNTRTFFHEDEHETATVCGLLLASSFSFKSEVESTREMALMTLTNLMTPIDGKSNTCITIGKTIASRGGLEILIELCTRKNSSLTIKDRSSALLSRLVSVSVINLDEEAANKAWGEFLKLTTHKEWMSTTDSAASKSRSNAASNLLKLAIASFNCIHWSGPVHAQAMINLLPKPRTNTRGVVDSKSVCQPPEKAPKTSAMAFAYSTSIFFANLLKLLIHYLDLNPSHHLFILKADGIEYLVCAIANSDHHHEAVTKNAATALARLIKTNDPAKQRCRDLRGMEILLELGQSGRI